jgi:hypothetical protein
MCGWQLMDLTIPRCAAKAHGRSKHVQEWQYLTITSHPVVTHRCAARCMGATVVRAGKCGGCKGSSCKDGKKNELCFLNSKNCWSKKYTCGSPLVGSGEGVMGKCVAKAPVLCSSQGRGCGH